MGSTPTLDSMLFRKEKCIFVHIPKTGGTTTLVALGRTEKWPKTDNPYNLRPHMNIGHIKDLVPFEVFERCFKFTFVRNPWDRAVSTFHNKKSLHHINDFESFIRSYRNASDYCIWPQIRKQVDQSQLDWISDENGKVAVDFIGRFEHLRRDLKYIFDKIGVKVPKELPHRRNHPRPHYTEYYDDHTKQIVAERFAKDIEFFGYEFGK